MTDVVLGIDSSTQSTKVEARDLKTGQVVAAASAPHVSTTPPVSEQDPISWWLALVAACNELPETVRDQVVAVSVAGQQHGLVLLDDAGAPVRPAKLWNDTTSAAEASAMVAAIGPEEWAAAVGSLPVAAFTISKLAWVANHEPSALRRVAQIMLPHDYLTLRLSGKHVTDRGDASGTGWFDASTNLYRPEMFNAAGLDAAMWLDRLPQVLDADQPAGMLTESAATELGLKRTVVVGPGSGDNMGAALGLGLEVGDLVVSLGTSGVAYARSATPTRDSAGAVAGFADATGGFLPLVCTLNATKVTDTVARWLGTDASGLADLALAAESTEVTVVPWFDGERTPNRPDASGTLFGLRTDTTREQLALAAHDGVLCGLLNGVDALAECGVDISGTLHLIGGGSRSSAYRQRAADLWGRPVAVPHTDETVAAGAAAQAASMLDGHPLAEVQTRWELGASELVGPNSGVDVAAVRGRYAEATNSYFDDHSE
jgi:xylulokinase